MSGKLNLAQARQLLWQAVETQGEDFVYNPPGCEIGGCINVPADLSGYSEEFRRTISPDNPKLKTGCLVGTAMKLSKLVDEAAFPRSGSVFAFGSALDPDALVYLQVAQEQQDGGGTWGSAYKAAEIVGNALETYRGVLEMQDVTLPQSPWLEYTS